MNALILLHELEAEELKKTGRNASAFLIGMNQWPEFWANIRELYSHTAAMATDGLTGQISLLGRPMLFIEGDFPLSVLHHRPFHIK